SSDVVTKTAYDGRGNPRKTWIDGAWTTDMAYDAYDRRVSTTRWLDRNGDGTLDRNGDGTDSSESEVVQYDRAGFVIATEKWGPKNSTDVISELLAKTESDYDEL